MNVTGSLSENGKGANWQLRKGEREKGSQRENREKGRRKGEGRKEKREKGGKPESEKGRKRG